MEVPFEPTYISDTLGMPVVSHAYHRVKMVQVDLVNFTQLAQHLRPQDTLFVLSALFAQFDRLVEFYRICKVETVGDA